MQRPNKDPLKNEDVNKETLENDPRLKLLVEKARKYTKIYQDTDFSAHFIDKASGEYLTKEKAEFMWILIDEAWEVGYEAGKKILDIEKQFEKKGIDSDDWGQKQ